MAWVEDDAAPPQTLAATGGPLPNPKAPTWDETIVSSWRATNPVANLAAKIFEEQFPKVEGYNPKDIIRGTKFEEFYSDNFIGDQSPQETRARMARIEQEEGDARVRAASGAFGLITDFTFGNLDPSLAFPAGALVKSARGGYSLVKSGLVIGGAGASQIAAQEAVLQGTRETHTAAESGVAIGTGAIFSAIIGAGAARLVSRAESRALTALLERERVAAAKHIDQGARVAAEAEAGAPRAAGDVEAGAPVVPKVGEEVADLADDLGAGPARAEAAGAAATRTDELVPVSYGFDKIPGWSRFARFLGTDLGIYSAKSIAGKRLASEIFETTLRFRQNLEGEVTSPVVPLDREVRTIIETNRIELGDEIKSAYAEYRFGQADKTAPFARAEIAKLLGNAEGKMSPSEFDKEVAAALQRGDVHDIPQVQRVAQYIRKKVLNPWAERMERANPDFKRQEFPEGKSYFPYSYDNPKIEAERTQFVDSVVFPHLKADQGRKAAAKERLQRMNSELTYFNSEIRRFEGRLERLAAREEDLASRLDERAMEVSRAEKRAGVVEERASSLAEDLTEIADFIGAMRAELKDPAMLARLDAMEKEAAALKKADRPVTEADLRKIEKEEVDAILTGPTRMAAEMLTGRRAWPKIPSFLSWIVANGGIRDEGGEIAAMMGGTMRTRPGLVNKQGGRALDELAQKIQEEARGWFPERPGETGGGAPDINTVLDWIDDALRGKEPDWWADVRSPNTAQAKAAQTAAALDEMMTRAGVSVNTIGDVGKFIRDGKLGDVTLEDLDKIAASMEAAGESIPVRLRRAAADEKVDVQRETITEIRDVIARAMKARESSGRRLQVAEARGEEAGIAERANRGRLGLLQDRMDRAAARRELLRDVVEINAQARDRLRERIEAEIGSWDGKTVGEAKAALKQVQKYEGERAERRVKAAEAGEDVGVASRLTGADDAVDTAVRRILASDRDLSDAELRDKAEEITDHVLGTPIGRLPYDIHVTANERPRAPDRQARGPLLQRDFAIDYDLAKDWLSHDLNRVLGNWMRTMVPDTLLHERFPGEGPALTSRYRQIQEEYAGLVRAATSAKERTRLNREKDALIETLDGVLQRIRGTLNNTEGLSGRVGETVRRINQMTDLGFAGVTSLPDLAGPIFYHGLTKTLADGWAPFFSAVSNPDVLKMSNRELRAMSIAAEIENSTRGNALAELAEVYHPQTKAERAIKYASDRFFLLNMQAQETQVAKQMAGRVAMADFLRAVKAEAEGTATQRQIVNLRESNVDASMAKRIWEQFNSPEGGATIDGTMLPNTANWTDERAKMHAIAAIARDVERAVVTPGQEKPLWISTNAGGLIGQFKTFSIASGNKLLISNLQRREFESLQGLVASVGLGVLSYRLSTLIRGDKWPERPQDVIKEGISRSGILGPMEDINMFAAKASSGYVDMYKLIGADKPLSRNANRTILSSMLGPTAGKVESIARVTGALGARDKTTGEMTWNAGDTHALRRLVILQNLVGVNKAFDAAEGGFNSFFGIPPAPER